MNLQVLIEYLDAKENLSRLEKIVLTALRDVDFVDEYARLKYLEALQQAVNVLNAPQQYDSPDNAYYQQVLAAVSNTYRAYLYDTKGKYTNLKAELNDLQTTIRAAQGDIANIEKVSKAISGEKVLSVYALEFEERAKTYDSQAARWQKMLIGSYLMVAIIVVLSFGWNVTDTKFIVNHISGDLKDHLQIGLLVFKALMLLGAVQLSRFFSRNYNACKHLNTQTLHKHDVLRALEGVYKTLSVDNVAARDELIKTGAIIAFQNIESGYLTVKEGAGDADAYTSTLLTSILKK